MVFLERDGDRENRPGVKISRGNGLGRRCNDIPGGCLLVMWQGGVCVCDTAFTQNT